MAGGSKHLAPDGQHPVRHWLAFLASGGTAFAADAAVLELLTSVLGVNPIGARPVAISLAMVAGWLMHRTFTFAVPGPPSAAEFIRYASVAWTASALNYVAFVAILLVLPATQPLAALVVSSVVAMAFAYLGMRFGAFRRQSGE